ncbi:cytidylyltransferase domain-containing protein [Methylohalobius crimeensis]|uniref:cytidylyltransferase domain-containing protein n=1 Tax=Methylohalobius crimeensis TaxID=244365 RepID=UPI0003B3526D|nr:glycosyltransferase [Methylohalobius crimeensis]
MKTIVIIPARGGSKGIPRKNLRPLAGKPLIYYSIRAANLAANINRVVVSTEDDEIALFAQRFGATVLKRPGFLSADSTTLDPVIEHAVSAAEEKWDEIYDRILTVQPTSPLVTADDIERVCECLAQGRYDTAITVVDDRHLTWGMQDGVPVPNYSERLNRQQLPPLFKETGAIVGCTRKQIKTGTRIGTSVGLVEMPVERSVDIDTFSDWYLCDGLLKRKRIVFAVVGYAEVGLGHAYRAVTLAHEFIPHELIFVCEEQSELAANHIRSHNYNVKICPDGMPGEIIITLEPDLVINDVLDTSVGYVEELKSSGAVVVNFEDMGSGANKADLVINALYPKQMPSDNILVGPKYFCIRDEFLFTPHNVLNAGVERMLITFGGVDEGNLTQRVLDILLDFCESKKIEIDIVIGPGYRHKESLESAVGGANFVTLVDSTTRISDYMARADIAVTSGGRTVLELAALEVPTIVICQNQRETTHAFASSENGVINLGYRDLVSDEEIKAAVIKVVEDSALRERMRKKARALDLSKGKRRVVRKILSLMDNQ